MKLKNWGGKFIITKDPFKDLSFFISPGLNYLGKNLWKCESKTSVLFLLSLIGNTVILV